MTVTAASTATSTASRPGLPPGPKGAPLLGLALQVLRDPLATLMRVAREYGDIVCIPVFRHYRILLNHPDYIEQVCIVQHAKFHKSTLTKDVTQRLLGQGLLISEGDFWRRQRRLAQPAFHRTRIAEYGTTMVECAGTHMRRWQDGEAQRHRRGDDGDDAGHRCADAFWHDAEREGGRSWQVAGISDAVFDAQGAFADQSAGELAHADEIAGRNARRNFWIRWCTGSSRSGKRRETQIRTTICWRC